jgi:hypothetical protein
MARTAVASIAERHDQVPGLTVRPETTLDRLPHLTVTDARQRRVRALASGELRAGIAS